MADNSDQGATPADQDEGRPLFRELDASEVEAGDLETTEIESLCMTCGKTGVTRMLMTKIPLFQEVIVMSFHCPHCQSRNNEIQPGAPIQDQGIRYTLTINDTEYLNRLVVKADSALVRIPELEFEIPPNTQRGSITTVESILSQALTSLEQDQPVRRALHPELASKLDEFIAKLRECLEVKQPFTLVLDDPAGNSFVENRLAPAPDPFLSLEHYHRSQEQDRQLGILPPTTTQGEASNDQPTAGSTKEEGVGAGLEGSTEGPGPDEPPPLRPEEVMAFLTNCPNCHSPTETRMKLVDIPHFKQVIVMATSCDHCGHRSNEVKAGMGVSERGSRITLRLTDPSDLSRDILKAETATISIPELEFEVQLGTLGGRFTTIEGLLDHARAQLRDSNPFAVGDSASDSRLTDFLEKLGKIIEGKQLDVHIILDDPAGNSYIQNVYAPESDPEMTVEHYERNFEQNELLGLNDMKTENYTTEDS